MVNLWVYLFCLFPLSATALPRRLDWSLEFSSHLFDSDLLIISNMLVDNEGGLFRQGIPEASMRGSRNASKFICSNWFVHGCLMVRGSFSVPFLTTLHCFSASLLQLCKLHRFVIELGRDCCLMFDDFFMFFWVTPSPYETWVFDDRTIDYLFKNISLQHNLHDLSHISTASCCIGLRCVLELVVAQCWHSFNTQIHISFFEINMLPVLKKCFIVFVKTNSTCVAPELPFS